MNSKAFPFDKTDHALRVNQLLSTWVVTISLGHLVGRALEGQRVAFSEYGVQVIARWFRCSGFLYQALLPEVIEFQAPFLAVV